MEGCGHECKLAAELGRENICFHWPRKKARISPDPIKGFFLWFWAVAEKRLFEGKRDYGSSILCLNAPLATLTVIINCSF